MARSKSRGFSAGSRVATSSMKGFAMTRRQAAKGSRAPSRSGRFTRILVFILPLLASFGPLLPAIGSFYAFRTATLVVLIVGLTWRTRGAQRDRIAFATTVLATVMVAVTMVFLLLGRVHESGVRELMSVLTGLALVVGLTRIPFSAELLRALTAGWLLAFIATAAIALRERVSGVHMPNYLPGREFLTYVSDKAPASTFGNPNDYAMMLLLGVPILIAGVTAYSSKFARALFATAIIVTPFLISATESRLGVTLFALIAISALQFYHVVGALVAVPIFAAGFSIAALEPSAVTTLIDPAASSWSDFFLPGGSGGVRSNLIQSEIVITVASYFLGVGPGNFGMALSTTPGVLPTSGIGSPHSGVMELTSQYGLVALIAMVIFFSAIFWTAWKGVKTHRGGVRVFHTWLIMLVLLAPIWTMMTSTTLSSPIFWAAISFFAWTVRGLSSKGVNEVHSSSSRNHSTLSHVDRASRVGRH